MALTAPEVFRDYATDGVPSSGPHDPKKSEIRTLLGQYEQVINAFTSNGGLIYDTRALLYADLAKDANRMAWVIGDSTAAYNGVYKKVGASGSGSWTRVADLPYSFIVASDVGDGTPDAIVATSSLPVSGSALVLLNIFETNTGSPVTVSFNGGAPLTVKSNSGNDIVPGGLVSGMLVMGRVSGSTFRLVSDQVSAAILTQAEDAATRAETAAATAEAIVGFDGTAGTVGFDNAASGLAAENVQEAIDELADREVAIPTLTFGSKADAQAYIPNIEALEDLSDFIRLEGYYSAGDGGGALYRKVATEPVHAGKLSITVPEVGVQWYEYVDRAVNVLALGASHTLEDNAPFFNDAVEIAQDFRKGGVVYFPAPPQGQVYTIKSSINVTKRCTLRGEDIDVQIYAVGFSQSVAMINVQRGAAGTLEFVTIEKLTLRDDEDNTVGGPASGLYFENCAHILMRDVRLFSVYDGIYLEASGASPRSFSNRFENVVIFPQAKRHGVIVTSFNGGGQHKFDSCTFGAVDTGFLLVSNSGMSGLVFANCNFEQCGKAFRAEGLLEGVSFDGCYAEKNGNGYTFGFLPTTGNLQAGISIKGCFFETDSESYPILLGGAGEVVGFNITANRARDYPTALVRYNTGTVYGGEIVANQIGTATAVTSNGPATDVRVANNRNNSGAVS